MCAAGATGLRFLFLHTISYVPPSSFMLTLPPTHLLHLPERPQIQLLPGSSGRQLHRYSWEEFWYATRPAFDFIAALTEKTTEGLKRQRFLLLITYEAWREITWEKEEQRMWCSSSSSSSSTPSWLIRGLLGRWRGEAGAPRGKIRHRRIRINPMIPRR